MVKYIKYFQERFYPYPIQEPDKTDLKNVEYWTPMDPIVIDKLKQLKRYLNCGYPQFFHDKKTFCPSSLSEHRYDRKIKWSLKKARLAGSIKELDQIVSSIPKCKIEERCDMKKWTFFLKKIKLYRTYYPNQ